MKCRRCQRAITRGAEENKRVECRHIDGEDRLFGVNMPDGKLSDAKGQLVWVKHQKCYWIDAKAGQRARTVLRAKQEERAADPGNRPRPDVDWPAGGQTNQEIEELLSGTKGNDGIRDEG